MRAIKTKYFGPTDSRGARIKATDGYGHSKTIPYPHYLSIDAGHRNAAEALCEKMGWNVRLVSGWFGHDCFHIAVQIYED